MALRDIFVRFDVDINQAPLIQTQNNVAKLVVKFNQLQRIAGFAMAALGVRALTESADAVINLENRLRSVTNSVQEFESAQRGVVDVARKTYTPIEDAAALFQRYTQVTTKLGLAQSEVLDFTHRLTQATRLSGATAGESRGALIQLAQGIGTNFKASGQEIRSIQEQAPELAKIIAKAAGGSTDDLMAMAKAGKITSKLVVDAVRNAGPELDRAWAKRTKSFEDISNRFTTEWQMLVKQLLPTIAKIIDKLGDLVQWTQEWVEKGEAMNTMIAAAIIVVGGLTVAFSALALKIMLVTAPFIALFLVVEDFVTFMRGGDSIIGRFFDKIFGEGGAERARQKVGEIWEYVKAFFAWLGDPAQMRETFKGFYDSAIEWVGKAFEWIKAKIPELSDAISAALRKSLGNTTADFLGIAKPGQGEYDRAMSKVMSDKEASLAQGKGEYTHAMDMRDATLRQGQSEYDYLMSRRGGQPKQESSWWDKLTGSPESSPMLSWDPMKGPMLPEPNVSATVTSAPWVPGGSKNDAPEINNNIVVQGNATPEVARMIAREAGNATAASLGRDRSAIGAGVGLGQ